MIRESLQDSQRGFAWVQHLVLVRCVLAVAMQQVSAAPQILAPCMHATFYLSLTLVRPLTKDNEI